MKLTHIVPALALLISPLAMVSCGDKGDTTAGGSEEGGSATATAKSHSDIGKGMVEVMNSMMDGMSKIKDVESAKAFADKVPELKTKMKELLEAAKSLPAPTDEEKAAVNKMMDDAQEKAGPVMMQTMMGMGENPDAEAIGEIMEGVMKDEEMDKVGTELEEIYKTEKTEEEAPEE